MYINWNVFKIIHAKLLQLHNNTWNNLTVYKKVSRTLPSILAVLNNDVVWIDSTRPPTSKSSSPLNNP